MLYKDINISFIDNIYGDFPIIEDADCIKATLMNNLLLSNDEVPFENTSRLGVYDLLHQSDQNIAEDFLKDAINNAIRKDNRIKKLNNLNFEWSTNEYSVIITIQVEIKRRINNKETNVDFRLIIKSL